MVSQNNNQNNGKVQIHGKTYQTVAYRLAEFRKQFPPDSHWNIATKCLHCDDDHVIFKATIKTPDGQTVATGHAFERWSSSPLNQTSAYENCETSAIGRALAAAGFIGSEFASADEVALAINAQSSQASKAKPQLKAAEAKPQPQPQAATTPAQPPLSQATQPAPQQPAKPAVQPAAKAAEPSQAKPAGPARPAAPNQGATQPNEQMAEKWTRDNLAQWLDTPCQFAKAQGRTWRQLAENQGDKIEISGKPCQPRAYLHALESWQSCQVWARMKARVTLAVIESKNNKQSQASK
ncbi:MAG: hypothetical protein AAB332_08090 [Planctomycetota bacterium]